MAFKLGMMEDLCMAQGLLLPRRSTWHGLKLDLDFEKVVPCLTLLLDSRGSCDWDINAEEDTNTAL